MDLKLPATPLRHDAIGEQTCGRCRWWHNPDAEPMGLCIKQPPTALMVGHQPVKTPQIHNPNAPPMMQAIPIVLGFHPPRTAEMGCGEWERRLTGMN